MSAYLRLAISCLPCLIYNFFVGYLFFYLFFFFDALLIIQDPRLGWERFLSEAVILKLVVMSCFQLLPSYRRLMLLLGSRGVQRGESRVFLRHIPLRWGAPCPGPFGGSRSGSKIVLSGAWQAFSVRRVIYIQCHRLSIRADA